VERIPRLRWGIRIQTYKLYLGGFACDLLRRAALNLRVAENANALKRESCQRAPNEYLCVVFRSDGDGGGDGNFGLHVACCLGFTGVRSWV